MKTIVLIGNTASVFYALQELRRQSPENDIILICPEGCFPYDATKISSYLEQEISQESLECQPRDFYTQQRIQVICDKKVQKVYPKRKRILFEDKQQIAYDVLILEERGAIRFSDIKGTQKKGVFHLKTLQDANDFIAHLASTDVVVIEAEHFGSIKTAFTLRAKDKEVIVIARDRYLLSHVLDEHTAQCLTQILEESHIRCMFDNEVKEVLGNGDVKAVRLKSGKVLGSQAAILGGAYRELTLFDDREILRQERFGHVQIGDIFLIEEIQELKNKKYDYWESIFLLSKEQGRAIAAAVLNQAFQEIIPNREIFLNFSKMTFMMAGQTKANPGWIEYLKQDFLNKHYKKVFVNDGILQGAVLLNYPHQHEDFCQYIRQTLDIRQLPTHILEDQAGISGPVASKQHSEELLSDEQRAEILKNQEIEHRGTDS